VAGRALKKERGKTVNEENQKRHEEIHHEKEDCQKQTEKRR